VGKILLIEIFSGSGELVAIALRARCHTASGMPSRLSVCSPYTNIEKTTQGVLIRELSAISLPFAAVVLIFLVGFDLFQ
jgi:hypothetical protein